MSAAIEFTALQSPIPRDGYGYWLEKKADRPMPARADFDPMLEVPKLSRSVMLQDVKHDPLDFRYRLIGTQLRPHMGQDWGGMWMSEIAFQRAPSPIWTHHQWVVENRAPRFIRPTYVGPHKEFMFIEAAILPLGADPARVDMLMIFVDFISKVGTPKPSFGPMNR
jgi:hypothetical protein